MAESSRSINIIRTDHDDRSMVADVVAVEEPLEIQLSSAVADGAAAKSVSITMRTPGHDDELALGFLYTEGILGGTDDVQDISAVGQADEETGLRNTIRVQTTPGLSLDLDRLQRHFYTTSSCGVCGKASLAALDVSGQQSLAPVRTRFPGGMLISLTDRIRDMQRVFAETGGLHAAAAFGPDGEIHIVREDIGRHNATDKVIGALVHADQVPGNELGLFVSGRASFELMQKALVAGIPLLAAVGAPSSLAVDMAKEFGMTLVGFLRDGGFNVYAGEDRII